MNQTQIGSYMWIDLTSIYFVLLSLIIFLVIRTLLLHKKNPLKIELDSNWV